MWFSSTRLLIAIFLVVPPTMNCVCVIAKCCKEAVGVLKRALRGGDEFSRWCISSVVRNYLTSPQLRRLCYEWRACTGRHQPCFVRSVSPICGKRCTWSGPTVPAIASLSVCVCNGISERSIKTRVNYAENIKGLRRRRTTSVTLLGRHRSLGSSATGSRLVPNHHGTVFTWHADYLQFYCRRLKDAASNSPANPWA